METLITGLQLNALPRAPGSAAKQGNRAFDARETASSAADDDLALVWPRRREQDPREARFRREPRSRDEAGIASIRRPGADAAPYYAPTILANTHRCHTRHAPFKVRSVIFEHYVTGLGISNRRLSPWSVVWGRPGHGTPSPSRSNRFRTLSSARSKIASASS